MRTLKYSCVTTDTSIRHVLQPTFSPLVLAFVRHHEGLSLVWPMLLLCQHRALAVLYPLSGKPRRQKGKGEVRLFLPRRPRARSILGSRMFSGPCPATNDPNHQQRRRRRCCTWRSSAGRERQCDDTDGGKKMPPLHCAASRHDHNPGIELPIGSGTETVAIQSTLRSVSTRGPSRLGASSITSRDWPGARDDEPLALPSAKSTIGRGLPLQSAIRRVNGWCRAWLPDCAVVLQKNDASERSQRISIMSRQLLPRRFGSYNSVVPASYYTSTAN
jgi:hypothetical protein